MRADEWDDAVSTADTDILEERPQSDPLAMERARARIELAMFGEAEPARLGRFEILEPIAGGGMGIVYAAHDPDLDRRVALKVVHPGRLHDEHARDRLLKEARALARLDHPNVVKVHDVLSHEGQLVVVMALIDGDTLAQWETARRRDWRDVVAAYVQAGEGLAAAHSVDVIHRDFKPGNAVRSTDGIVRVLDFGLARFVADHGDRGVERASSQRPLALEGATAPGAMLGTPAYASPEQLSGAPVTAASDQFSFCVSLHHALEGVAPFTGGSIQDRIASIRSQQVRDATDGRHVPRWLRRVVRRGLTPDPAGRHSSMSDLLDELRRPRGWQRWRSVIVTFGLTTAAVAVTLANTPDQPRPTCDGAAVEVAGVWGPAHQLRLAAVFDSTGVWYAREVRARVVDRLDGQVASWAATHREVCVRHRDGLDTDAMFDRKMHCLRRHLELLEATVAVLKRTNATNVDSALAVTAGAPSPTACTDGDRVMTEEEPIGTAQQAHTDAVRAQVDVASKLERQGRSAEAAGVAQAAVHIAELAGDRALLAEALLEEGRLAIYRDDLVTAKTVLARALREALQSGRRPRIAVEAGARHLYAEFKHEADLARAMHRFEYLDPMARALGDDGFVLPLLLNNIAAVQIVARRTDEARRYLAEARAVISGRVPDPELFGIEQNLAVITADHDERARLALSALQHMAEAYGEHHARTLWARTFHAQVQIDPAKGHELLGPVCEAYRARGPTLAAGLVDCIELRAFLAAEHGRTDEAIAAYTTLIALPDLDLARRELAIGERALLRGALEEAGRAFTTVLAERRHKQEWWTLQDAYQAALGLAIVEAARGQSREARAHFRYAADGYEGLLGFYSVVTTHLRLRRARRGLDETR